MLDQSGITESTPASWMRPHLWRLLIALCDWILPAEGNRMSASQARAPEWLVFVCERDASVKNTILGGLCLINYYSLTRCGVSFLQLDRPHQQELISALAFRANADDAPDLLAGVIFFATLRAWVLNGFFTSEAGHRELGYVGNVPRAFLAPCPPLTSTNAPVAAEDLCPVPASY